MRISCKRLTSSKMMRARMDEPLTLSLLRWKATEDSQCTSMTVEIPARFSLLWCSGLKYLFRKSRIGDDMG